MHNFTHDLIETKLSRPSLPPDLIHRPRLTDFLDLKSLPPLILTSAPAGYGKSTITNCLVDALNCPSAWVQLDERDNNLVLFLSYFLAAIHLIYPRAMAETQAIIKTSPLPPLDVLVTNLINELNQIKEKYLLVLDDYHYIHEEKIHELLDQLLLHPPSSLHLVLSTRMDPPLSLARRRARGEIIEIRAQDLRFSVEETRQLLQRMLGSSVDDTMAKSMEEQTEGWVTGLRLAALAIRLRVGQGAFGGRLSPENRYVTEYLIREILAKQTASLTDCLLKSSILDRFCVDLCEVVCFPEAESSDNQPTGLDLRGGRLLEWLQASNLFVIALDDNNEWFRYHHLFQSFLRQELTQRFSSDEILRLHSIAGQWYAQNGWIDEAIEHLLASGDTAAAIGVIAEHRYDVMNRARWSRLEHWLKLFSIDIVETSAELLMLKTWLLYHRGQFSGLFVSLQHISAQMTRRPDQPVAKCLMGEVRALQSLLAYHTGDAEGAISLAREALELLEPELWAVRLLTRMYLGGGLLLRGDAIGGYRAIYDGLDDEKIQSDIFKATLLLTACSFHWVTADLQSMTQAAKQSIALSEKTESQQITGYGYFHLGRVYYQQNNLRGAEELFAKVVDRPYRNYGTNYIQSACGLGMTYQALGKEIEAQRIAEAAIAFLLERGNSYLLSEILALQAELAMRQGRLYSASQWAEDLDPLPPLVPLSGFLAPHLTLVKVWLAQNTPVSWNKAASYLGELKEYLFRTHNTRFLIETLALQTLLDLALGNKSAALTTLEKALRLAQPGGFIRIFVDMGPQMARALTQVQVDRELHGYVKVLLSAFPKSQQVVNLMDQEKILEPLTNRELQILELLGNRLTNKEIATQLMLSPGTIKGHTIRIFHKLDVGDRRQAVKKAIELGLLSPSKG